MTSTTALGAHGGEEGRQIGVSACSPLGEENTQTWPGQASCEDCQDGVDVLRCLDYLGLTPPEGTRRCAAASPEGVARVSSGAAPQAFPVPCVPVLTTQSTGQRAVDCAPAQEEDEDPDAPRGMAGLNCVLLPSPSRLHLSLLKIPVTRLRVHPDPA